MLPLLTERLLSEWSLLFPEVARPKTIEYLGVTGSVEGGTTTFLGFGERCKGPLFAAKVHRVLAAGDKAQKEREVLSKIRACKGEFSSSVPRIILCDRIGERWVVVQSILKGQPMTAKMRRDGSPDIQRTIRDIGLVSAWLLNLQQATRPSCPSDASAALRRRLKILQEFSQIFQFSLEERAYLKGLESEFPAVLDGYETIEHGDFCRQNILISNGRSRPSLNVIDWTDSSLHGLPFNDLFFFLATYAVQARREAGVLSFVKLFEETFLEKNPYSDAVRFCVTDYCARLGIETSLLKTMFGIFLVEQAVSFYHKFAGAAKQGGLPRFILYLAAANGKSYDEAYTEQRWIYYFRSLVRRERQLIF